MNVILRTVLTANKQTKEESAYAKAEEVVGPYWNLPPYEDIDKLPPDIDDVWNPPWMVPKKKKRFKRRTILRKLEIELFQSFSTTSSTIYHVIHIFWILFSCGAMIALTQPSFIRGTWWMDIIESTAVTLFTADYIAKIVFRSSLIRRIDGQKEKISAWTLRFSYMFSFHGFIDIVSILPYYIELIVSYADPAAENGINALMILRMCRLVKLLPLLYHTRLRTVPQSVVSGLRTKFTSVYVSCYVLCVYAIILGTAGYFAEQTEEVFLREYECWFYNPYYGGYPSPWTSVFHGMYWAFVTMATVGFGDIVTVTPAGRVIACISVLISGSIVAIPLTILGNKISSSWMQTESEQDVEKVQKYLRRVNKKKLLFENFEKYDRHHYLTMIQCQQGVAQLSGSLNSLSFKLDSLVISHKSWNQYLQSHPDETKYYIPRNRYDSGVGHFIDERRKIAAELHEAQQAALEELNKKQRSVRAEQQKSHGPHGIVGIDSYTTPFVVEEEIDMNIFDGEDAMPADEGADGAEPMLTHNESGRRDHVKEHVKEFLHTPSSIVARMRGFSIQKDDEATKYHPRESKEFHREKSAQHGATDGPDRASSTKFSLDMSVVHLNKTSEGSEAERGNSPRTTPRGSPRAPHHGGQGFLRKSLQKFSPRGPSNTFGEHDNYGEEPVDTKAASSTHSGVSPKVSLDSSRRSIVKMDRNDATLPQQPPQRPKSGPGEGRRDPSPLSRGPRVANTAASTKDSPANERRESRGNEAKRGGYENREENREGEERISMTMKRGDTQAANPVDPFVTENL